MRTLLILLVCGACTATQSPRTLGKGNTAIGLSLGGPITRIPGIGTIPLPYPVLEGRYGVSERLDVLAGTHILLNAFGTPQLDLGILYQLVPEKEGDRSAVSFRAKSMLFLNLNSPLLIPEFALLWSARIKKKSYFYGGLSSAFGTKQALIEEESGVNNSTVIIASPFLGGQIPVTENVRIALETTWIAPYIDTTDSVVVYPVPGGPGAISVKLGFSYRLPLRQKQ